MATNSEKIDSILTIVQEIKTQNAVQAEQIKTVQECQDEHKKDINGNGKPGLKRDMEKVKGNLILINWIGGIIAGAVIMDAITRLIALVH